MKVIVVVEDNPDNRLLLRAILDGSYSLREYDSGPAALSELDPASAAIVTLRDVEGLSPQDVERVLDVTPSDQRELLARGRARVWEALS